MCDGTYSKIVASQIERPKRTQTGQRIQRAYLVQQGRARTIVMAPVYAHPLCLGGTRWRVSGRHATVRVGRDDRDGLARRREWIRGLCCGSALRPGDIRCVGRLRAQSRRVSRRWGYGTGTNRRGEVSRTREGRRRRRHKHGRCGGRRGGQWTASARHDVGVVTDHEGEGNGTTAGSRYFVMSEGYISQGRSPDHAS